MPATMTKRPSDAEVVKLLKTLAAGISAVDPSKVPIGCREEAMRAFGVASALEAASAEPFEAKVDRAARAIHAKRHPRLKFNPLNAACAEYKLDAREALRAAGVEG